MTTVSVLGAVSLGDGGAPLAPRDRVVLSVLVARRGQDVSADTIADALWGESPPPSWPKVIQGCVARLRRRLGHGAIATDRTGYRLTLPAEDIDAGRFERLAQRSRELLALDQPDQAAYAAQEGLSLWRGAALSDLEDWEPGRGEAQRLTELRLQVEELHLSALLASGHHAEALSEATLRVQEQPLREHRWSLLARSQYQDGRQAEALSTVRRAREVLAEELGLDPGEELVRLERAVLAQDPTLAVPAAGRPDSTCPWPGLASYDVEDADTFFGREAELAECLVRLERTGFLAVVGPSGSGKSSLVRAGLAARLRHDGRDVRVLLPGPRPLDALAEELSGRASTAVLIVDQCEEIFARTVVEPVRAAFLARLVQQASQGLVVITLRADRLDHLTAYPEMARLVEDGLYLLKGIGVEGLRRAIESPARRAGLLLEHGLVDLLVRDVAGEPGSLPLLAHALRQTWERREGSTLTVEGYRASGGIQGAVAQSAEHVYQAATEDLRHALRELLLRMVQPGPGGEAVRTSVAREMVHDGQHAALVEQLVRARLVTAHADRLEIAHEALARAWPRLQSWLAEDVQGERIRHHLAAAADAWESMGRPESELYRGARLAAAREWREAGSHTLGRAEQEFLAASERAHQSQLARAEEEARRQRRLNHRLRLLVAGAVVLALVAAVFGITAGVQWQAGQRARAAATAEAQRATSEAQRATSEAQRARSHELASAAVAAMDDDPALAKSLAVLAAQEAPSTPQTREALQRVFLADPVVSRVSMNHFVSRLETVISPDGARIAMSGETAFDPALAVEVHDAVTGELVWEWVRPDRPGYESALRAGVAYSPDGQTLASGLVWAPEHWLSVGPDPSGREPPEDAKPGVHLYDARTHELLDVLDLGPCGGWPLEVTDTHVLARAMLPSESGKAGTRADPTADCDWDTAAVGNYLVERSTGKSTSLGTADPGLMWHMGAAMSDDGSVTAVLDPTRNATTVVDTATGRERLRLPLAVPHDLDAAGQHVLVRDHSEPVAFWRVVRLEDGQDVASFHGHSGATLYGTFGPDGTVATTATDTELIVWDSTTGREVQRAAATGEGRPSAAGDRWVTVPRSSTYGAVVVDRLPRAEGFSLPPCTRGFVGADQLRVAAGRVVAGRDCDGSFGRISVADLGANHALRSWDDAVAWQGLDISADGRLGVAQAGRGAQDPDAPPIIGALTVRDLDTGEVTVTLEGFCEHPIWELGECARPPQEPFAFDAWRIRWSPDGRWIAAVDTNQGVLVWDSRSGDLVADLFTRGSEERQRWGLPFELLFSPASDRLIISTSGSRLVVVDTTTWQSVDDALITLPGGERAGVVGHSGGLVVVVAPYRQNATVTGVSLFDARTLEVRDTWPSLVAGSVRSGHVSPDGSRLALATSEGYVGVWDLGSGERVDRIDPGADRIQGVQWVDDTDLMLLGEAGHMQTVTTDPDRLLSLVSASLTRGLSPTECAGLGIDPCPDRGTLRGTGPTVPAELRGSWHVSWSADEARTAATDYYEAAVGGPLDRSSRGELTDLTGDYVAGDYLLTFTGSDWTVTKGDGALFCTGPVSGVPDRPDRLLLGVAGGECLDFAYAEIGWQVQGDTLRLPREEFRGPYGDALIWTIKPLTRVDRGR